MRLTILFLFFVQICLGQTAAIDSLSGKLASAKTDIEKADLLNALADAHRSSDPAKMREFATKSLGISQKIKYRLAEAMAQQNIGNSYILSGNYDKAAEAFRKAQKLYEQEVQSGGKTDEARIGLGRALGSLGIVFSEQSNYAMALHYDLEAIRIYEQMGDNARLARLYNNTGIVYLSQENDFKALEYLTKSIELQAKDPGSEVGTALSNIGKIYLKQKNFDRAIEYFGKSEHVFQQFPDARGQGELMNNLGNYYFRTGNLAKAETAWKSALRYFKVIDDRFGSADTHAYLSEMYLSKNELALAEKEASVSLSDAIEMQVLEQQVIARKLLGEIFEKQGNLLKALREQRLYTAAKDSLMSHENIRRSVQSEMNYDFEKRETLAKKESEKREILFAEASKRHLLQTVFAVLLVLLVAGIGFLWYSRSQLRKNLTLQKELAEYEQKALHLQMNPHFVFNCLGSISSFIVQNGSDQAIKYLAKFSKLMRLTLEYSKESLIPIDREIEALQNYLELEQLRFNNIFAFDIVKSPDIEDDVALPPLLLQPFVENAIIHGIVPRKEGGRIDISFTIASEFLICAISDNGIGIERSKNLKKGAVPVHRSMAIDITRKRLDMIQSVLSKPAEVVITETADDKGETTGTAVVIRLPLQYLENEKPKTS